MELEPFKLERYFAKYEFNAKYLLSSSDCDGFSLDYVLSAAEYGELELWNNLKLGYTDSLGHPLLRDAITRHYNTIKSDEVFVLSPGEANFILMHTYLQPEDEVVCIYPAYQSLYQVVASIGCKLIWWKPDDTGYYNPDDLNTLVTQHTKMIIVNFPHNPTGFYPSADELNRIVTIASRNNTLVFSDEMYHKLVDHAADVNDSFCDLYDNAVCLWGMAKSFGLAGIRIGWITTHNHRLLNKMQQFKDYLTICNSAPSEILAMIALNNSEQFIEVNLQKIRNNKLIFKNFIARHQDMFPDYHETRAGSTAFVNVRLNESTLDYAERVVKETGIMLVPAEMFEYGSTHFRIGFGRANFAEALAIWENYINSASGLTK